MGCIVLCRSGKGGVLCSQRSIFDSTATMSTSGYHTDILRGARTVHPAGRVPSGSGSGTCKDPGVSCDAGAEHCRFGPQP
jgi:hypothetical protein